MAKIGSYFLAVRLGLLEHIEDGRLSFDCLGVWLYLAMKCKAGKDNGVVMTNDAALAAAGAMTKRQVATARRKLEAAGFIRKLHDGHKKGKYAIILHRYQPTRGSQEVFVDAFATTDYANPVMIPGSQADFITNPSGLQVDPISTSSGTLIAPARREKREEDRVQRKEEEEDTAPSGPSAADQPEEEQPKKTDQVPYEDLFRAYNEVIEGTRWSKASALTIANQKKRTAIRARYREAGSSVETFREIVGLIAKNHFLRDVKSGDTSIGWVLGPNNWADLVSGKYPEDGTRPESRPQINGARLTLADFAPRKEASHA